MSFRDYHLIATIFSFYSEKEKLVNFDINVLYTIDTSIFVKSDSVKKFFKAISKKLVRKKIVFKKVPKIIEILDSVNILGI